MAISCFLYCRPVAAIVGHQLRQTVLLACVAVTTPLGGTAVAGLSQLAVRPDAGLSLRAPEQTIV